MATSTAVKAPSAATQARSFAEACERDGFSFSVRGDIVSVTKTFTPGDSDAYVACDGDGPCLLAMVPSSGGSTWGTDGGSVGGMVAIKNGRYRLNVSGVAKRFVNALSKI